MAIKSPAQIASAAEYRKALAADLKKLKTAQTFVWLPTVKLLTPQGMLFVGNKKTDPVVADLIAKNKGATVVTGNIDRNNDDGKVRFSTPVKRAAVNKVINDCKVPELTDIVEDASDEEEKPKQDNVEPTTTPVPKTEAPKTLDPLAPKPMPNRPPPPAPEKRQPEPPKPQTTTVKTEAPEPFLKRTPSDPSLKTSTNSLFGGHRPPPTPRTGPSKLGEQPLPTPPPEKDKEEDGGKSEDFSAALEEAEAMVKKAREDVATFEKRIGSAKKLVEGVRALGTKHKAIGLDKDLQRLDLLTSRPEKLLDTVGGDLDAVEQELKRAGKSKVGENVEAVKSAIKQARDIAHKVSVADRELNNVPAGVKFMERSAQAAENLVKRLAGIDQEKVTDLTARAALISRVDSCGATDEQKEILKSLVLVSSLDAGKVGSEITGTTSEKKAAAAIEKLRKKTKSTEEAREVFAQAHLLMNDVYRYFGDGRSFSATLTPQQQTAFNAIKQLAMAEYTLGMVATTNTSTSAQNVGLDDEKDWIKPDPKSVGRGVAVVGGGPVGLLAAIESAMKGAKVQVYEARGGDSQKELHNRMNTIKLEDGTLQRLRKVGVWSVVLKKWDDAAHAIPVGVLETALLERAGSLGVKFFDGKSVVDAVRQDSGKVELTIDGDKNKTIVDLVVVAAGASFSRASGNAVNAEKLGFEIVKAEARDFAVTGVFDPTKDDKSPGAPKTSEPGWAYGFNAPDVKYMLAQVTESQYDEFRNDPIKLQAYVRQIAINHNMGDRDYMKTKGGTVVKPATFPIEVQQSQNMTSKKSGAVLVGDSAATPHPSTAKGLNTGSREIDSIANLVEGRENQTDDEALAAYDWEVNRATNVMVAEAMTTMVTNGKSRSRLVAVKLGQKIQSAAPKYDAPKPLVSQIDRALDGLAQRATLDDGSEGWPIASAIIKKFREIEAELDAALKIVTADGLATDVKTRLETALSKTA